MALYGMDKELYERKRVENVRALYGDQKAEELELELGVGRDEYYRWRRNRGRDGYGADDDEHGNEDEYNKIKNHNDTPKKIPKYK